MTMHKRITTNEDLEKAVRVVRKTGDKLVLRNTWGEVAIIEYFAERDADCVTHSGVWEFDFDPDTGREFDYFVARSYVNSKPLLPKFFLPAIVLWWPGSIAIPAGVTG